MIVVGLRHQYALVLMLSIFSSAQCLNGKKSGLFIRSFVGFLVQRINCISNSIHFLRVGLETCFLFPFPAPISKAFFSPSGMIKIDASTKRLSSALKTWNINQVETSIFNLFLFVRSLFIQSYPKILYHD